MKNVSAPQMHLRVSRRMRYASKTAGKKLSNNRTEFSRSLSCQVRPARPPSSVRPVVQGFPCPGHLLAHEQHQPPRRISIAKLINPSSAFPGGHAGNFAYSGSELSWLLSSSFPHLQRTENDEERRKGNRERGKKKRGRERKGKKEGEKGKRKRVVARRGRGRMDERRGWSVALMATGSIAVAVLAENSSLKKIQAITSGSSSVARGGGRGWRRERRDGMRESEGAACARSRRQRWMCR